MGILFIAGVAFLAIAAVSGIFGFTNTAHKSAGIAKNIFYVSFIIAVLGFIVGIFI